MSKGLVFACMLSFCVAIGQIAIAGPSPCANENGDTNGDKARDISDAVYLLAFLFQGGAGPVLLCDPAGAGGDCASQNGDANGDKALDLSDGVYSLAFLFHGGAPPASICAPNIACTTYTDIQPILQAKCSPCHIGMTPGSCFAGGTCFASFYEDTQGDAGSCAGKTVYECMLIRILNGSMPRLAGCSGNPAADAANASCITSEELDLIESWVTAGAPESDCTDTDEDGICDVDDTCTDLDGDGVGNGNATDTDCATATVDSDDADPFVCADDNQDGIDDCTYGRYSTVEASGTYSDVQPILQAKCSPCHVGETAGSCFSGGTCFASFYEDTQGPAGFACSGRTLYECIIIRIKNGTMPRGRGCSGNPTQDADNTSCLDANSIQAVEAWALNGGPETP